jgi:hypothetical protein
MSGREDPRVRRATCPGQDGPVTPYNARGRRMHLVTCPACGREFRFQGHSTADTRPLPTHNL